jgi:hypothetical protein
MIYRNSKGKFISKEEWLSLQPKEENKKTMNNSRRRKSKQTAAELNAEQVTSQSEIAEGTQITSLGSDFDIDEYKRKVEEFEKSMEEEEVVETEEEEVEPTKTPGFFTTWFKKWF